MGVSFTDPLWWLLLPVLGVLIWYLRLPWLRMSGTQVHKRRERRRLYTRLGIVILLVAVLSGPGLVSVIQRQAVVMALDVSASIGPAVSEGERWVRETMTARPPGAAVGVVSFGRRAMVEEPSGDRPNFYRITTDPGQEASHIGEALKFSKAILPAGFRQRVVLLTDGRDTENGALAAARVLQADGVRVDVVPLGNAAGSDVRLDNMHVAPQARVGENTAVELNISSDSVATGEIYLERDGELIASRPVQLRNGKNRLVISVPAGQAGLHRYRARLVNIDQDKDSIILNNEAGGIQEVAGPPRVLVLAPSETEARGLIQALRAAGNVDVTVTGPSGAPRGMEEWARYQAVFVVNVPAYKLGERVMQELETYVRDGGGGLVMVGGPDSYGPGGYAGTPVERAMPVDMDIKGRGELPSLGLMLVIDKSGSMGADAGGADKMSLAREAAARSISVLTERDWVGVLAFDSVPWWVIPPGPVDNKDELQRLIGSIQAGGGTEIYPPLLAAYQALRDMSTQVKHIILLTDGMSASGGDYEALLSDLQSQGITLSTVAVGAGADAGMLQALAEIGRGRFYATVDADNIPAIFTKETVMATRSFAVNERFYPHVASSGTLLRGLSEVPPLDGYITATAKDLAETVLLSPKGDPVLAAWQYGLGRAVAWTPDAGGRWSGAWAAGDTFPRLWGNILSWILPSYNTDSLHIAAEVSAVEMASAEQTLHIEVDDPGGWQEVRNLNAVITGPDGSTMETPLQAAGPGRYIGNTAVEKPGAYLIAVTDKDGEQQSLLGRSGVVVSYPAEYRETGVDMEQLKAIARAGGGTVLEKPEQAFADNLSPVRARRDLAAWLLSAAAILWLLDVAGRRLVLGAEERAALQRFGQTMRQRLSLWREKDSGKSTWTGETLTRVQELRRSRDKASSGSTEKKKDSRAGSNAAEQVGNKPPTAPGGVTDLSENAQHVSSNNKDTQEQPAGETEAAKPADTASRLLQAKRQGFKK